MQFSKRNPLLNNGEINDVVGSLGEEMSTQDLVMTVGGGIKEDVKKTVTAVVTSAVYRCGYLYTVSAECNPKGIRCGK